MRENMIFHLQPLFLLFLRPNKICHVTENVIVDVTENLEDVTENLINVTENLEDVTEKGGYWKVKN